MDVMIFHASPPLPLAITARNADNLATISADNCAVADDDNDDEDNERNGAHAHAGVAITDGDDDDDTRAQVNDHDT